MVPKPGFARLYLACPGMPVARCISMLTLLVAGQLIQGQMYLRISVAFGRINSVSRSSKA